MATIEQPWQQQMSALQRANAVRREGVAIKALITKGAMTIADALGDHRAGHLPVRDVLRAQPKWGYGRASRVLRSAQIAETRRVRMLTGRQREAIVAACDPPLDLNLFGAMPEVLSILADADRSLFATDLSERGFLNPGGTLRALERRGLAEGRCEDWTHGLLCWQITPDGRRAAQS
jgi:hypothetical protein